jgi:hypothetical protein
LRAVVLSTPERDFLPVELKVNGAISPSELSAELDSTCRTLDERRRRGVRRLREIAATSQNWLLDSLSVLEAHGVARNIRSHWLTNTISVDLTPPGLRTIARHRDLASAFQYPEFKPIEPERYQPSERLARPREAGVEPNLLFIGADSCWRMGLTGEGRIVCNMERTDGAHPAIYDSWKGHDGDSLAAWNCRPGMFGCTSFPSARMSHGTHIMGSMVGHDDATGDTIGVALDARWIASPIVDFEWAADPDGDPGTTADMPDVINLSLSTDIYDDVCNEQWWDMIDIVEALGTVVVIAAGNTGPDPYTVNSPANRAVDSLTNFAVGSVDYNTGNVWWSSSRGPSKCDSTSIKPNVCAPGVNIRSAGLDGEYEYLGGTSMAAPHVAGAVAILRQYAPNATVRQIKEALIAGARPQLEPSPNNHYGWGTIYIPASIDYLARDVTAAVDVVSFDYQPRPVSEMLSGTIRVANRGRDLRSLCATFRASYPGLHVLTPRIDFGRVSHGDTVTGFFECTFDDTMYPGPTIPIPFAFECDFRDIDSGTIYVQAGNPAEPTYFGYRSDQFSLNISNFGKYQSNSGGIIDASLMLATDSAHVSDCFNLGVFDHHDDDFWYDADHPMMIFEPGLSADQETISCFDDGRAENRIGVAVRQKTYSWNAWTTSPFVLFEYEVTNISDEVIDSLFVGLACQGSFTRWRCDTILGSGYLPDLQTGYLFSYGVPPHGQEGCHSNDTGFVRGLKILNNEGVNSYRVLRYSVPEEKLSLSEDLKFRALSEGIVDTGLTAGVSHEPDYSASLLMHFISSGPFSLNPWQTDTVVIALIQTRSMSEFTDAAAQADIRWESIRNSQSIPRTFRLRSNYPNPFNSGTVITFDLPQSGHVTLDIYNILGQHVKRLLNTPLDAGEHHVMWDGRTGAGGTAATGVYFYRLRSGRLDQSRKMMLLR